MHYYIYDLLIIYIYMEMVDITTKKNMEIH